MSKLKFRRAGLDQLRLNETLRAIVRLVATDARHAGRREFALYYLTVVACSDDGIGTVAAGPREALAFAKAHRGTFMELLGEIIGKEATARFETEL